MSEIISGQRLSRGEEETLAPRVQRCGGHACASGCADRHQDDGASDGSNVQLASDGSSSGEGDKKDNCGPGTHDPFCLGLPGPNEPCKPFLSSEEAQAQWNFLSKEVPLLTSTVTGCGDVKDVWEAYFARTSKPFTFSSGCVVSAAKSDELASRLQDTAAALLTNDIILNLPVLLRAVAPNPFRLGGPIAELHLPLEEAIGEGPRQARHLHPTIIYNTVSNAAANIAGDIGESDVFGKDDRVMSGRVVIQIDSIDPATGAMSGQIRWVPHVRAIDTVDFCPGNLGTTLQQIFTVPMSKLEAMGMTRDVPITISYDLDLQEKSFKDVRPFIGPLPKPKPRPGPGPGPTPPTDEFPKSGPARTTGSLLRIRTAPSLKAPVLGLLGNKGTPIKVETQIRGDSVDGNDIWDRIDRGFVSHRFVAFEAESNK